MFSPFACLFLVLTLGLHVLQASVSEPAFSVDISNVLHQISVRKGKELAARTTKTLRRAAKKSKNGASGSCRWDAKAEGCTVGYSAVAELFGKSSNEHAQFVAQFERCLAAVDAEECAVTLNCTWDKLSSTCRFVDFYTGRETSPCVIGADGSIQELVSTETCALHETQLSCYKDPSCAWSETEILCETAGFFAYIGVPFSQVVEASQAVVRVKMLELMFAFPTAFDFEAEDFKFEDILDWKVPETSCPSWSDPLVCKYADGIVSVFPQTFYCGAKHSGFGGLMSCVADPMCHLEAISGTCRQTDDSFGAGVLRGIKNLVEMYVEPAVDKEILLQSLECIESEEKDKCKDPCVWRLPVVEEELEEGCELPGNWMAKTIAEAGDISDPVCKMVDSLSKTKCADISDVDECNAEPDCSTWIADGCWLSLDYQVKDVTKNDGDLKSAYEKLEATCAAYKRAEECNAST